MSVDSVVDETPTGTCHPVGRRPSARPGDARGRHGHLSTVASVRRGRHGGASRRGTAGDVPHARPGERDADGGRLRRPRRRPRRCPPPGRRPPSRRAADPARQAVRSSPSVRGRPTSTPTARRKATMDVRCGAGATRPRPMPSSGCARAARPARRWGGTGSRLEADSAARSGHAEPSGRGHTWRRRSVRAVLGREVRRWRQPGASRSG